MIPLRNRDILIEALREGKSIEEACEISHISKPSLYRLMKKEPGLQNAFEHAIFEAKEKIRLEDKQARNKGMQNLKELILKRKR